MSANTNTLTDSYDVVVIGAGLGGMTAANRLATSGHNVLLLEKHNMLGGYATYFRRGPHIFDVALHAFPVGMAKTFRKYWSADIASRVVQLKRIRFENPQFSLRSTFEAEDFLRILAERFGVPRETGEAFFRQCRSLNFYDDRHLLVRDLFDKFFPDNRPVRRLLLETVAYATGVHLDDPALCYGIVFSNFMQKGTYSLLGGTDRLLVDLRRELEKNGVTIALRTAAEKILFRDGRAAGVRANGRDIAARAVVSNANLKETAFRLAGEEHIPAGLAQDIRDVSLSLSVAQVYIGFKAGTELPDLGDILFTSSEPDFDDRASTAFPPPSRSYSIYYPRHLRPDHDRAEIVASARSRQAEHRKQPSVLGAAT